MARNRREVDRSPGGEKRDNELGAKLVELRRSKVPQVCESGNAHPGTQECEAG